MIALIDTPKDKNLVFDVGLHRGEDAEFYLKKGFRVVAFEANPELVAECEHQFRSCIAQGQLKIIQGAIAEPEAFKAGQRKIAFYRNETGSVWGTICPSWAKRNAKAECPSQIIEVDAVDFSQALREHGIPHYMKVDIEGCDTICLKALEAFRERPDYISIESDKTSFRKIRNEIDLFSSLGYKSFQAVEQSGIVSQSPPSTAREGRYTAHSFVIGASGLFGTELPGRWMSSQEILRLYRYIRAGYFLLGDDGILNRQFRGAGRLRAQARRMLSRRTQGHVPGWYDTHARLCSQDPQPAAPVECTRLEAEKSEI